MRNYGIDTKTGKWTTLTQSQIIGASNPVTYPIQSVYGVTTSITSTLYNALTTFNIGASTVNNGDILQNDVIIDSKGNILYSVWQDITQNFILSSAPLPTNIAQQTGGFNTFLNNYGLTVGEQIIVDVSYIWLATLVQTLRLNTNESPFYSNYGIPAERSVHTQIAPDLALNTIQSQFAPYFASLAIIKQQNTTQPTYNISAVFLNGTVIQTVVAT